MDRTSWKPKVFKATESVDYKVNEVNIERGGSSMKIDGKNVIKIWESFSGWYWYAIEDQGSYTGIGADGNEVQAHAWYGYVQGMENEWGTWDSNELERAGVWTVPKSNWGWTGKESKASENWKDVANKFYKEELNKGKKSVGEGQHGCPFCGVSFGGSFVGHVRKNHTKEEFTQLQNDGWIPERSVYGEAKASEGMKDKNGNMICHFCGSIDTVLNILEREIWEGWEKYEWWCCKDCGNCFKGDIVSTDKRSYEESKANEYDDVLDDYYHIYVEPNSSSAENPKVDKIWILFQNDWTVGDEFEDWEEFAELQNPSLNDDEIKAKWNKEEGNESKADDIRNAIAQDHEQWRKKQEPEQARQFLNNYQIPLSNKQSDYYPYDWGNQNNFSEDGFALSDTLAKNQGQSWQKGGEAYFVEWGYDLDYDFEEVDDINEAKQLAKDNGGNVYLDNKLVYSVIPSIKKDPTNDKSSFTMANNLMGVESKASEYDCESCGGEYSNCPHCGHGMHDYEWEDSNDICDSCEKGKYDESYSSEGHRHRWVKEDETDFCLDCDKMRPTEYEMGAKGYDHTGESKANEEEKCERCDGEGILSGQAFDEELSSFSSSAHPEEIEDFAKWGTCPECGGKGYESKANELDLKNYTIIPFGDVWVSECKQCGAEFTEYDYDNSENSVRNHLMSEHGIDDSHLGNTLYDQNESKASETWRVKKLDKYGDIIEEYEAKDEADANLIKTGMQHMMDKVYLDYDRHTLTISNESKASEGFNQGLHGYVDAKCKTCGVEFDSIPDMDDHYAMNSDHISNLDDLDNDIPNSD